MTGSADKGEGRLGSRWRLVGWTSAAVLLMTPLFAMQVADEVAWNAADFIFFGGLMAVAGLTFELVVGKRSSTAYRAAAGMALGTAFILVWANGAVGVIGNENNDANLMYIGVLSASIVGAVQARFQPEGMSRVMVGTALAQALVAVIALIAGFGSGEPGWPQNILMVTGFFVALWLISAWLFHKAASEQTPRGVSTDMPF